MALFVQRNEERTALQERLESELQEKVRQRALLDDDASNDPEQSAYLKGTKQTTSLAWIWMIVVVLGIAALVVLMLKAGGQL